VKDLTKKPKIVVLIGPTAVGKTKTSITLAKRFNGEIISGDSMQVYRHLDIGTAKITEEEMDGIPHHLIDMKDPTEPFTVAEFQKLVRKKIVHITEKNALPMIVGGTGLYIQSVLYDYQFSHAVENIELRKELEQKVQEKGNNFLHQKLMSIDPDSAKRIHPNNVRRVIRALEIYHCTGKTMNDYKAQQQKEMVYDAVIIGLTMEREKLYERINERVEMMMEKGLLEEVKWLYDQNIRNVQSIQAIGYKELYEYLDGKKTLDEAVSLLKRNSRRFAKRQLTWFRNKLNVNWFDMSNTCEESEKVQEISDFIAGKLSLK